VNKATDNLHSLQSQSWNKNTHIVCQSQLLYGMVCSSVREAGQITCT